MYVTKSEHAPTTSDLAARLTDLALEAVAGAGMPRDSVAMELKLWHTLEAELERDRRWQHSGPRHGEAAPVGNVLRQVVNRAVQRVAGIMGPFADVPARRAECMDNYLCRA